MSKAHIQIEKLSPDEWATFSETAHLVGFNEKRPSSMDRIDYALVATDDAGIQGWLTARELDSETVYWQYGAAAPTSQSSPKAVEVYGKMIEWTLNQYKRISTLVENTNVRYLKLAMHFGFRIIGVRNYEGIFVELLNERKN